MGIAQGPTSESAGPFSRRGLILTGVGIFLLVFLVFLPALKNDFVSYDDADYVTENSHVKAGLTAEGIRWAFTTGHASNWHPLTWVSHMLDWQIFGNRPWGHHLTNVLLHSLNTLLLFLVLRRMTGAYWQSLMVALLFGLHPLRVESVAWVAERKDVLSTFFWMLTMWAYVLYAEKIKDQRPKLKVCYGLTLLFFACGLMSKPMLVSLPFVLLLLDWWPLGRIIDLGNEARARLGQVTLKRAVLEKLPLFAMAALSSAVTFVVQHQGGAVKNMVLLPLSGRLENAMVSYSRYVGKLVYPADLSVIYPHPGRWPAGVVVPAVILLAGACVVALFRRRQWPWFFTGWFWFVGVMVPVIGLVQVGEQSMADRYTLVPSIGLLVLLVWGISEWTKSWRYCAPTFSVAGSAALLICILMTQRQIGYWRDSEMLFRRATGTVAENDFAAQLHLANALFAKTNFDEAIVHYQKAIRLDPAAAQPHCDWGTLLGVQGRVDEAIGQFRLALQIDPNDALTHAGMAKALSMIGQGDVAIAHFLEAIRLGLNTPETHASVAILLQKQGRVDEAIAHFADAARLNPADASLRNNFGSALWQLGRKEEALKQFQEAARLNPALALAHFNIAFALSSFGRNAEAIVEAQAALKARPNFPEAERLLRSLSAATPR